VPVVDARRIGRDVSVPFERGTDHTPSLARPNDEIVAGIAVAASETMLAVTGVTDRILIIDLVAAAGEETAFIDFDNVAGAFEHPFHAATTPWVAFFVVHRGDDHVLRADRAG